MQKTDHIKAPFQKMLWGRGIRKGISGVLVAAMLAGLIWQGDQGSVKAQSLSKGLAESPAQNSSADGEKDSAQKDGSVIKNQLPQKWEGLGYALFSSGDQDTALYTYRTSIYGDIHTNHSFLYQGTSLTVKGTIEAAGTVTLRTSSMEGAQNVEAEEEKSKTIPMPDIREELRTLAEENGTKKTGWQNINNDTISLDKPLYVEGGVGFNATTFTGQGVVLARDSINYNVDRLATKEDSQLFLASEKGDITINGSCITLDGVLYAPEGCVRINANEFHLNGRIIAKQVCINGSIINIRAGEGDLDMLPFLSVSEPLLKVGGRQKENRKITLDLEDGETGGDFHGEDIRWSIKKEGKEAEDCYLLDEKHSDSCHRELLFTKAGTYEVTATIDAGSSAEKAVKEELVIVEDEAPEAGFTLGEKTYFRGKNKEVSVTAADTSYSPDGDEIGDRVWTVYYDKNNNGVFEETEKEDVPDNGGAILTYAATKVGRYKVELWVSETFSDTIPSLLKEGAFRTDDTAGKEEEDCIFEVDNKAPEAALDISKARSVDLVFTLGEADKEKISLYREKAGELEKSLKEQGVDARVDVADAEVLTAKDRFAWQEFDHYNYKDSYLPTIEKHILYDGDDIRMMGYGDKPIKDFLYVPDDSPQKKTFEFDLERDSTNWHSMEGGGFLFNTTVSEEKNTIQGFCVLVTSHGLRLAQIDCKNLSEFRDGRYSCVYSVGRQLKMFPMTNVNMSHHLKIEVEDNRLSVWDNGNSVVEDYVLPENDYGYGYGPITSYVSHSCKQQSYFTFRNIIMRTTRGKTLSDIVDGYSFRPGASHYVIHLSEEEVPEIAREETRAELAAALIRNEAVFFGIGTEEDQNRYASLYRAVENGAWYDAADLKAAMEAIGETVTAGILSKDCEIRTFLTTDDIVNYGEFYRDAEGDMPYEARWLYEYDPYIFTEESGKKERIERREDNPITMFDQIGAYVVRLQIRDNPVGDNDSLDSYRKWSEEVDSQKLFLVQSRPVAHVEAKIRKDPKDAARYLTKVEYSAYDPDHKGETKKGIRKEQFFYKEIQDDDWTEGRLPGSIPAGSTYLIRYQVKDIEGSYSFPAVAVVKTSETGSWQPEEDTEPPVISIEPERYEMQPGETIYIQGYAEDTSGVDSFALYIGDEKVSSHYGRVEYTAEKEGTVTIRATARDPYGNEAESSAEISVVDWGDHIAPRAEITSPDSGSEIGMDVQILGSAEDEISLKEYRLSYRKKGSDRYTTFNTSDQSVENGVLGKLNLADFEEGIYEILLTAEDEAGNLAHASLYLSIEKKTVTESYHLRAVLTSMDYREEEGQLYLYGTATAEGNLKEYELLYQKSGDGEYTAIARGTKEKEDDLLGSLYIGDLEDGRYEVVLRAEEIRGNRTEARGIFEKSTSEGSVTITETVLETPTPTEPPESKPTPVPTTEPGGEVTPAPTAEPTEKPGGEIDPILPPEPDIFDWDIVLKRSFGLSLSQEVAYAGEEVTAYVTLSDSIKEETVEISLGDTLLTKGKRKAVFTVKKPGKVTVTATGVREDGKSVSESRDCVFYSKEDKIYPTATIDTPAAESVLTGPADITGSACDETALDYYTLEYRPEGEYEYIPFATGTEPKQKEVLGRLDTTMLPNGRYEVRLTVVDQGGNRRRTTRNYMVEGNWKAGPVNLGFTDITASMGGTRVNVTRTYNSANQYAGDFGYGWSLGVQGMTLQESSPLNQGYSLDTGGSWFAPVYTLSQTKNHDIVIQYGDGTSDRFVLKVSPERKNLVPIQEVTLTYQCVTNSRVKLEIQGDNTFLLEGNELLYYDMSLYDRVNYVLTMENGVKAYLNAGRGVSRLEDKYGHIITVTKDGYLSDDGRSIFFTRDDKNRITKATDPNGGVISYAYDEAGNLASVTDKAGRTVTYTYDSKHRLLGITDPDGVATARNEYDEDGRLVAVTDSAGNRTEYGYDVEGKTQVVTDRLGNATVYCYDERGNITQTTDANGNTTKAAYDERGNVLSRTDARGNTTTYEYDENGNISRAVDALGTAVESQCSEQGKITSLKTEDAELVIDYDERGCLSETTDQLGNKTEFGYDGDGNLTSVSDSIGTRLTSVYDRDGNVIETTSADGTRTTYTYDGEGRRTSETVYVKEDGQQKERTTTYLYNEVGDLIQTISPDGLTTTIERDGRGNMVSSTDGQGRTTGYEYTDSGKIGAIVYSDGTKETFQYDAEDHLISSVNRLGQTTACTYDKVGNLLSATDALGNRTQYAYDENYNVTKIMYPAGETLSYTYDALNRNTSVTDGEGNTTTFAYDTYSLLSSTTDAEGNTTTYEYDQAGNRTKTSYADGSTITCRYDERGRMVWQKDTAGVETEYTYDQADRLTFVSRPGTGKTAYTYDDGGNLSSITDVLGNTVSYEYDREGRLITTTQPDGAVSKNRYDTFGRISETTDNNGITTKYTYDREDRIETTEKAGEVIRYRYDKYGRITRITSRDSQITYTYNRQGQLAEKAYENGQTISYGYDRYGRKNEITVTSGGEEIQHTACEYDKSGRVIRVTGKNGGAVEYTYDANGNRKTATYADGHITTYSYDEMNWLKEQKTVDKTGAVVALYTYSTGRGGLRTRVEEKGAAGHIVTEYGYDDAGRLIKEQVSSVGSTPGEETETILYTYRYDRAGNRTEKNVTAGGITRVTVYEYNKRGQLVSESTDGCTTTYVYDANGNLLSKTGAGIKEQYGYDAFDRMVLYVSGDTEETYTYDAEGVRRSKTTETGEETRSVWFITDTTGELSATLAETDGEGRALAAYTRWEELVSQTRDGKTSTYLYDGHGDVRALADEEGKLTDTYRYTAYGELAEKTGSTENHYLYTGEYYDGTTNLYYLRARYMNPSNGVFTSMDSYPGDLYEPVSLHKYLYANADPVKYTDPTGMFSLSEMMADVSIMAEMNKNNIIAMGLLNAMAQGALTVLGGGGLEETATAMLKGFVGGCAMGVFFCLAAVLTATTFLTAVMCYTGATAVVNVALSIYSVMNGNYKQALTYGTVAVVSLMAYCQMYNCAYKIEVTGEKGSVWFESRSDASKNANITSQEVVFGSNTKSASKLTNQMANRGWTKELVNQTVDSPYTIRASINRATGNTATVFYTQQGSYVIVDDVTKAIVQISDNIDPVTWMPDSNIVDPYIPK